MPELPDLEVFKENVFNRLTSKKLLDVNVCNAMKVNASPQIFAEEICGKTLLTINRAGKELLFVFPGDKAVSAHLMLQGKISILDGSEGMDKIAAKIFAFRFEEQTIVFSDFDGLCSIKYPPIAGKAPDAFDEAFTPAYLLAIAKKKPRTNVKAFLIDQNIVRGIGNAYADEILWDAMISPHSAVGKIPDDILEKLYDSIHSVLRDAILQIKAISPDIISGEVRSFLKVHNRALKTTETGARIRVEKIASKTTYYTDEQVLYF